MNEVKLLVKLEFIGTLRSLKSKNLFFQTLIWILVLLSHLFFGGLICFFYFIAMAESLGGIAEIPDGIEPVRQLMTRLPDFTLYILFLYLFLTYFFAGLKFFISENDDVLLTLPFSLREILLSRLIASGVFSLGLNLVLALPSVIVYAYLYGLKTIFPFLILILVFSTLGFVSGTFLRLVITRFLPKLHWPKWIKAVLFLIIFPPLFALYMYEAMNEFSHAGGILYRLIQWYNKFYGPTDLMTRPLMMVILIIGSGILTWLMISFIYRNYFKLKNRDQTPRKIRKLTSDSYKVHSPMVALVIKEYRLYWSITALVQNTAMGAILLLMVAIASTVPMIREAYIGFMTEFNSISQDIILLFVLFFGAGMVNVTYLSFSAEQGRAYNTYALPLSGRQIFLGKLIGPLLFVLPIFLIASFLLIDSFRPQPIYIPFLILAPLLYLFFSNGIGLFFDSKMANYDWDNETKLVKNSKQSLFSSLGSFVLSVIVILIGYQMVLVYPLLFAGLLTLLLLIANIILFVLVNDLKIYHK